MTPRSHRRPGRSPRVTGLPPSQRDSDAPNPHPRREPGDSRALQAEVRVQVGGFELHAAVRVEPGEIVALLGPNGAGKSTLLGAIAGHLPVADGSIRIGERTLDGAHAHVPPAERRVGLLGQRALLFPHLTALENVAFGPRSQGAHRSTARETARAWLDRVGLGDLAARRPAALSGGQQQRVAIARAFAAAPDVLLLDEPFAALDVQTAAQARRVVAGFVRDAGIPILLVTHDPQDARELADRTVVLQAGRVVDEGPTKEVLQRRSTEFVAALHAPGAWTATVADVEDGEDGEDRMVRVRTVEHPDSPLIVPVEAASGITPGLRLRVTVTIEDESEDEPDAPSQPTADEVARERPDPPERGASVVDP